MVSMDNVVRCELLLRSFRCAVSQTVTADETKPFGNHGRKVKLVNSRRRRFLLSTRTVYCMALIRRASWQTSILL